MIERSVGFGLRPEIIARELDGPEDVMLEGADEPFIEAHAPLELLADGDFGELREEFCEILLEADFDFLAVNVLATFKIKSKLIVLNPPLHQWQVPLLAVKQHQQVDIPREEKLRARVVGLVRGIINQVRVVRSAAFDGTGQFHFTGENQLFSVTIDTQVGAFAFDGLRFFNLCTPERPLGMLRKQRIQPACNAAAKRDFISANI